MVRFLVRSVIFLVSAAIGLLVGSVFVLTRHGPQVSSALMYPVFLLGGMLLPPETLPTPLEWVSYGISTRWLTQFIAGAAAGSVDAPALLAAPAFGATSLLSALAAAAIAFHRHG